MTDIYIHALGRTGLPVAGTSLGTTITIAEYGAEPEPPTVILGAARDAKTTAISEELVSVSHGHVSPRDDGGSYINLTALPPGNTVTEITGETPGGQTVTIDVIPRRMLKGFSDGRHWMLPIDRATGMIKFEVGRKGRKYFVTKRPRNDASGKGGWTKTEIAAQDGVSLATVTNNYIRDSAKWGRSADFPLEMNTGFEVWAAVTPTVSSASNFFNSSHLVLERGYDYRDGVWGSSRHFVSRATSGESPLHPLLLTSYGTGPDPIFQPSEGAMNYQTGQRGGMTWIAFQDVSIPKFNCNGSMDTIFSHINLTTGGCYPGSNGHTTLYRVGIWDAAYPVPDRQYWPSNNSPTGTPPHVVGTYLSEALSLLVIDCLYDKNGWMEGYSETSNETIYPYPPTALAHNLYLQYNFVNTTIRRQFNMRGASLGIQLRGGGLIEDVFFADNNIALNNLGYAKDLSGAEDIPNTGNIPVVRGPCVIMSGAEKYFAPRPSARGRGMDISGYDGFLEAIIMHRANPADAAEIADRTSTGHSWGPTSAQSRNFLAKMRIHNWSGQGSEAPYDAASWGRSAAALNQITLQNFAETRMDLSAVPESGKLRAYCLFLRTLTPAQRMVELEAALRYTWSAWGITRANRSAPAVCVFIPDTEAGSGVLWADYPNWSTGDVAGKIVGDSAELRGVNVVFGEVTVEMDYVDGQGGSLEISSGSLTTDELRNCSEVVGSFCGHLYLTNVVNVPSYRWNGGRLMFNAAMSGADLVVDGQYPEVILGPNYTVSSGKVLDIRCGRQGAVGWDGTGSATLTIASGGTLRFRNFSQTFSTAAGNYANGMSRLERFRSGFYGEAQPTVAVSLVLASGAIVDVDTAGLAAGTYDLTGPGVTVTNPGNITLPAGVTLTGGKLVLTVSSI